MRHWLVRVIRPHDNHLTPAVQIEVTHPEQDCGLFMPPYSRATMGKYPANPHPNPFSPMEKEEKGGRGRLCSFRGSNKSCHPRVCISVENRERERLHKKCQPKID